MALMPFLHDPHAVARLLRLVRLTSHPRVVSDQHLRDAGFGPDEIPGLVDLLCALGMIDARRQPTTIWTEYRHSATPRRVLAQSMRHAYPAFFATLPRPDRHDDIALRLIAEDRTELDPTEVALVVATFRELCRAAGLGRASHARTVHTAVPAAVPVRAPILREIADLLTVGHADLDEAHACLAAGLHRAAHVAAWNGLTAVALIRITSDEFTALRAVRPHWNVSTLAEVARRAHGRVLIDLLVEMGLVDPLDEFAIAALLERRDRCARPTPYRPTAEQTRDYLDQVVARTGELSATEHPVSPPPDDDAEWPSAVRPSRRRRPTPQR